MSQTTKTLKKLASGEEYKALVAAIEQGDCEATSKAYLEIERLLQEAQKEIREKIASLPRQNKDVDSQKFQAAGGGTAAAGAPTGITGKVAAVSGNKVYLNIGSAEGVAVGMVFVISNVIEEVKDPDTGEVLDVVTEDVCEITIAEVKERTSNGPITASLGGRPQKGDVAKQKY